MERTINTIQDIQDSLNDKYGKGKVRLLSVRQDGTVAVKGLWDERIFVRYFLKKLGLVCLNKRAEEKGYTAIIGVN